MEDTDGSDYEVLPEIVKEIVEMEMEMERNEENREEGKIKEIEAMIDEGARVEHPNSLFVARDEEEKFLDEERSNGDEVKGKIIDDQEKQVEKREHKLKSENDPVLEGFICILALLSLIFFGVFISQYTRMANELENGEKVNYQIENPSDKQFFLYKVCIDMHGDELCSVNRIVEPGSYANYSLKRVFSLSEENKFTALPITVRGFLVNGLPIGRFICLGELLKTFPFTTNLHHHPTDENEFQEIFQALKDKYQVI